MTRTATQKAADKNTDKDAALQWRSRPTRAVNVPTGEVWRRYLSTCGRYRVSVRITGPGCTPQKFYAERIADLDGDRWLWQMIGKSPHRTKAAAINACEREARRAAK